MTEVWKDIKGFEGIYQVSNLGRVKSLARKVNRFGTRWGKDASYMIPETIRAISETRNGYLYVPLTKDKKAYPRRLHRLVAEAFIDGYSESIEVHHKDGDITNNKADNLECILPAEHKAIHVKHKKVIGMKDGNTISFESISDVVKDGFDPANVSRCCKAATLPEGHPRKRKYATHKGYMWRYADN